MTILTIALDTVVGRNESLLSADLGDDVVMMDIDNGSYYGLEAVASRIWSLLETPCSARSICAQLVDEYEIEAEQCEREVLTFLERLLSQRIVHVVGELTPR